MRTSREQLDVAGDDSEVLSAEGEQLSRVARNRAEESAHFSSGQLANGLYLTPVRRFTINCLPLT
jgi:hypothetical protein